MIFTIATHLYGSKGVAFHDNTRQKCKQDYSITELACNESAIK